MREINFKSPALIQSTIGVDYVTSVKIRDFVILALQKQELDLKKEVREKTIDDVLKMIDGFPFSSPVFFDDECWKVGDIALEELKQAIIYTERKRV